MSLGQKIVKDALKNVKYLVREPGKSMSAAVGPFDTRKEAEEFLQEMAGKGHKKLQIFPFSGRNDRGWPTEITEDPY